MAEADSRGRDRGKLSREDIHCYSKKISFDSLQYSRLKDKHRKD